MKITYIMFLLAMAAFAVAAMFVPAQSLDLTANVSATALYAIHMATLATALLATFFAIRYRSVKPLIRMAIVAAAADMVILVRLLFQIDSLQYMLCILLVSYLFIWRDIDAPEV